MTDGKGALYFIPPQATKMTRQQLRESSPSGEIKMDKWMGKSFTFPFIACSALAALAFTYVIDWLAMSLPIMPL